MLHSVSLPKRFIDNLWLRIRRKRPLGLHEVSVIARSFSQLMAAGYGPEPAFNVLLKQSRDKRISDALTPVASDLHGGVSLAFAFEKQKRIFGPLFCRSIELGGPTGKSGPLFSKLAEYYEKTDAFKKSIRRKIKYPCLMVMGVMGSIVTLLLYLMITAVTSGASPSAEDAPVVTKLLLSVASFLQAHAVTVFVLFAVLFLPATGLFFTNLPYSWFERISWRVPFFGDISRKNELRRFSLACSFLLSAGLDFPTALRIAASELRNPAISMSVAALAEKRPKEHFLLAGELKTVHIYPSIILDMLQDVRSQSDGGTLFEKVGEFYQEEVEALTTATTLIIEPVTVVILGLLSAGFLIALYFPMIKNP